MLCWRVISGLKIFLLDWGLRWFRWVGRISSDLINEKVRVVIIISEICLVNCMVGLVISIYGENIMIVVMMVKMMGLVIICVLIMVVVRFFFLCLILLWMFFLIMIVLFMMILMINRKVNSDSMFSEIFSIGSNRKVLLKVVKMLMVI